MLDLWSWPPQEFLGERRELCTLELSRISSFLDLASILVRSAHWSLDFEISHAMWKHRAHNDKPVSYGRLIMFTVYIFLLSSDLLEQKQEK